MNIRPLVTGFALFASLGFVSAASAAGVTKVSPAEFGRDGVPSVTVEKSANGPEVQVQAFGRDVPATRRDAARTRTAVDGNVPTRFGRA